MTMKAIRKKVTVQPGGNIELSSIELPAGETVEVILLVDEESGESRNPLTSAIGSGKGNFATPEEADDFIRQLRGE
ncbi:MAG: hypothetical protein Fur0025_46660 [Oscillatoriaceae cyanobacterium]